jgi:membrane protease YdiL (CAAX protease family)
MNNTTRKELIQFFVLTFAYSWLIWLPGVLSGLGVIETAVPSIPLVLLGGLGPAFAAIVLTARAKGRVGLKALAKSALDPRRAFPWLLGASALLIVLHASARFIYSLVAETLPVSAKVTSPLTAIVFFIIVFFLGGGLDEEIGWRGYALDRLQTKFSALNASLILSAFWIVWHLPLTLMEGTNQSLVPFWLFTLAVIPLGIILTWIYNSTGSIFAAAFFHALGNVLLEVFVVNPTPDSTAITGMIILTGVYSLAAFFIIWRYGAQRLAKTAVSQPQLQYGD